MSVVDRLTGRSSSISKVDSGVAIAMRWVVAAQPAAEEGVRRRVVLIDVSLGDVLRDGVKGVVVRGSR